MHSFFNSPLNYFIFDNITSKLNQNNQWSHSPFNTDNYGYTIPSDTNSNTFFVTTRNPIAQISYSIYDYNTSFITYLDGDGQFEGLVAEGDVVNSFIYFPWLYNSFQITIRDEGGDNSTYDFVNSFYGLDTPIYFIENGKVYPNCLGFYAQNSKQFIFNEENFTKSIINAEGELNSYYYNSFGIEFISFSELTKSNVTSVLNHNNLHTSDEEFIWSSNSDQLQYQS